MTDKEKADVIDWLTEITENPEGWACFYSDLEQKQLAENALAMLKEREPVTPRIEQDQNGIRYVCGFCGETLFTIYDTVSADYKKKHGRFCSFCGRAVKR